MELFVLIVLLMVLLFPEDVTDRIPKAVVPGPNGTPSNPKSISSCFFGMVGFSSAADSSLEEWIGVDCANGDNPNAAPSGIFSTVLPLETCLFSALHSDCAGC